MKRMVYAIFLGIFGWLTLIWSLKDIPRCDTYSILIDYDDLGYIREKKNGELPTITFQSENGDFVVENTINAKEIIGNQVVFEVPIKYQNGTWMLDTRFDGNAYVIKSIAIVPGLDFRIVYTKEQMLSRLITAGPSTLEMTESGWKCSSVDGQSYLVFDDFGAFKLVRFRVWFESVCRYVFPGSLMLITVLFFGTQKKQDSRHCLGLVWIGGGISAVLFALCMFVPYGKEYAEQNFAETPIGQVIYHLHTPLEGANMDAFQDVIIRGGLIILVSLLTTIAITIWLYRRRRLRGFFCVWISIGLLVALPKLRILVKEFGVDEYWKYTHSQSHLYEDYYVDARDVELTFPERKRNLIYIYLESMETSYADTSVGGAMTDNYIPELTNLALENTSFSGSDQKINGPYQVSGATYTMGALVSQTAGVPINESLVGTDALNQTFESDTNWLPGVYAIGDVLEKEGYQQEFCIGSNGGFAGRSSYFKGHGNYNIFDYYSAIEQEYIPEDYYVWWGYEDIKLFEYAKTEIANLAESKEPFNFTLLTVDTHFTAGYVCEECESDYDQQYSNVIACSSKNVAQFVDWIREQPFYDNTTIVICGDHCTSDAGYVEKMINNQYDRRMYLTIINPADGIADEGKSRVFTSMDMYPTTLAAMGVNIEGDRPGLGVNLYSGQETLVEKYGIDELNRQLLCDSELYRKKLLYMK